jgi:hypothetical protein
LALIQYIRPAVVISTDALVTMNADINIETSHNDENEILQHCNSNKIEIQKQRKNEIEIKR